MMDTASFSVTGSHFQKSFEILQRRERERALPPPEARERPDGLLCAAKPGGAEK